MGHAVPLHLGRKRITYTINRCVNCHAALTFSTKGQSRGRYCSAPECKKVRDAERKRVQRAARKAPEAPTAAGQGDGRELSRAEVLEAPAIAPWGERYETLSLLWLDTLAHRYDEVCPSDPQGRTYWEVLEEAEGREPRRFPSPHTAAMPW